MVIHYCSCRADLLSERSRTSFEVGICWCMHSTSTVFHDDKLKRHSRVVFAVWRASHNLQQYHSVLLGSYILVSGHSYIHLRRVQGFKPDANRLPVFITAVSTCQTCSSTMRWPLQVVAVFLESSELYEGLMSSLCVGYVAVFHDGCCAPCDVILVHSVIQS